MELAEFFSFYMPGYQFTPRYRNKTWDGKIRLFNMHTKRIYVGLLPILQKFADLYEYKVEFEIEAYSQIYNQFYKEDEVNQFIKDLPITVQGKRVKPHNHQIDSIHGLTKHRRAVLLSPTSSGKSLIIYMSMRYYMDMYPDRKVLILVPTTSLVEQMYSDFEDYASQDPNFRVDEECHKIYSGKEKFTNRSVVISTWQSVYKLPQDWFSSFAVCINDETHDAKAKNITAIMEKLYNCPIKIGTTGTLDGTECNKLVIQGLFGPVLSYIKTHELMDKGLVANLKIVNLVLKYPEDECKLVKKMKYQDEIKFITNHKRRMQIIKNLVASKAKENTLILVSKVDHAEELFKTINAAVGDRKVYLITGSTKVEERERIRKQIEKELGSVIVATFGTMSTGVSIRNIHNFIFGSPTKSEIRTLQSIGRALRISESKTAATMYDVIDSFRHKSFLNYCLKHYIERMKIYNKEKFNYTQASIDVYPKMNN